MNHRLSSVIILFSLLLGLTSMGVSHAQSFDPCTATPGGRTPDIDLAFVAGGFEDPVFVTHANDGSNRLFVVEQPGTIQIIQNGARFPSPFLDIRDRVSFGGERGLLSVAFHPEYAENGRIFVNYTRRGDGATVIAEYGVGNDPDVALRDERVILLINQPFSNHNGGQIQFGPDGKLYIGTGDGGSAGDPQNHGQRPSTLLGSMLRIDVDEGEPYTIPDDNPFLDDASARDETYAFGLRNPWRFSFDRCDGRLFLGDVGQGRIEEVNIIFPGDNYGWNTMEGTECFESDACIQGGLELPIHQYFHNNQGGRSITGGYVYRGTDFPDLAGRYFYGDFVSSRIWSLTEVAPNQWENQEMLDLDIFLSTFGEDEQGELYAAGFDGVVYRIEQVGAASSNTDVAVALDNNFNMMVDDAEIVTAVQLWATGSPIPGTDITISDPAMKDLVHYWTSGQSF